MIPALWAEAPSWLKIQSLVFSQMYIIYIIANILFKIYKYLCEFNFSSYTSYTRTLLPNRDPNIEPKSTLLNPVSSLMKVCIDPLVITVSVESFGICNSPFIISPYNVVRKSIVCSIYLNTSCKIPSSLHLLCIKNEVFLLCSTSNLFSFKMREDFVQHTQIFPSISLQDVIRSAVTYPITFIVSFSFCFGLVFFLFFSNLWNYLHYPPAVQIFLNFAEAVLDILHSFYFSKSLYLCILNKRKRILLK